MATNTQVDKTYGSYDLEKTKEQVKQAIDHAYNRSMDEAISWDELDTDLQNTIDAKTTEADVNELIDAWGATHGGDSFYGVCNTTTNVANKTVQISGFTGDNLMSGQRVTVYFNYTNTVANPTLNISSTGAKPILQCAYTDCPVSTNAWHSRQIVDFVYYKVNGTIGYWIMLDSLVGSGTYSGNVKLSDATDSTLGTDDGTAATPAAVKAAYDKAVEAASGMVFAEGAFVNGTMSLTIPEISELTDKQTIRVRFTSDVIPYSTGLKLSINNGTAYSILLSNQDDITVGNYGTNVLWHSSSSIVLIYNLLSQTWMVDNSEYADRCFTADRAAAINGSAVTLSGNDIKQINHSGTKRNLMATDYDISNGTIKAKFDQIDKIIPSGVCSTSTTSNHVVTKNITVSDWGITPLQNGQKLTVKFVNNDLSALNDDNGHIKFTINNGTAYEFLPNGEDECTQNQYGYAVFAEFNGGCATFEFIYDSTTPANSYWKYISGSWSLTSEWAHTVATDYDGAKLNYMEWTARHSGISCTCNTTANIATKVATIDTGYDDPAGGGWSPLHGDRINVLFTYGLRGCGSSQPLMLTTSTVANAKPITLDGHSVLNDIYDISFTRAGGIVSFMYDENVSLTVGNTTYTAAWVANGGVNRVDDGYYDGQDIMPNLSSEFEWEDPSYGNTGILSYIGQDTNVIVPAEHYSDGKVYPVIVIDNVDDGTAVTGAFESTNVVTVVLPNTITNLAKNAFYDCQDLESVNIPSSMMSIGESAFTNCSSLPEIVINKKNVVVDSNAFSACTNLTVYCYQDSEAEDAAMGDGILVEYLDDVITYDTTSVTITIKNGKEYRCLNTGLASLTVNLPTMDTSGATDIKTEFDSLVTFYCGSSSFNFSGAYPSTGTQFIQYFGKDCDDGVFQPSEQGYVYNLAYWWNGKMYVCTVV